MEQMMYQWLCKQMLELEYMENKVIELFNLQILEFANFNIYGIYCIIMEDYFI